MSQQQPSSSSSRTVIPAKRRITTEEEEEEAQVREEEEEYQESEASVIEYGRGYFYNEDNERRNLKQERFEEEEDDDDDGEEGEEERRQQHHQTRPQQEKAKRFQIKSFTFLVTYSRAAGLTHRRIKECLVEDCERRFRAIPVKWLIGREDDTFRCFLRYNKSIRVQSERFFDIRLDPEDPESVIFRPVIRNARDERAVANSCARGNNYIASEGFDLLGEKQRPAKAVRLWEDIYNESKSYEEYMAALRDNHIEAYCRDYGNIKDEAMDRFGM
jgi:hypothetical protein